MRTSSVSALTADVLTTHGAVVHIRPISPSDRARLLEFYEALDPIDVYTRFFSHHLPSGELLARPTEERSTDFTLIVESGERLIAVGGYTWEPKRQSAEVAFAVSNDHRHQGLGTLLLEHLAARAKANGIRRFHAYTLAWNRNMLSTFLHAGYIVATEEDHGEVFVEFVLDDAADDAIDARDQRATAHSIQMLLNPRTVAVLGATNDPHDEGHSLVRNLAAGDFQGAIYPISADQASVSGIPAYASVSATPQPVDVALIAVPADEALSAVEECGKAGVGAVVVVSHGFAELSETGAQAEADLLRSARSHGMRLVGPNCIGVANTSPATRLHATVAPLATAVGNVSIATQSGALGAVLVEKLATAGLGIASFASLGNKVDVSGNDFLQYWESDSATAVGVLYLKSFGNPRKFARIASRFCRTKPLIVVTGGRSQLGQDTVDAHAASRATDPALVDALFHELGVINVNSLAELVDVTRLLAQQPVPRGNSIAIVSNSAGPANLAVDACAGAGLEIATLSPTTIAHLEHLDTPRNGQGTDALVIAASAKDVEPALDLLLRDANVDAVVLLYTDVLDRGVGGVSQAVRRASSRQNTKTVAATLISPQPQPRAVGDVPIFDFPEEAIAAIGHAARLGMWRQRPPVQRTQPEHLDLDAAQAIITAALADAARQASDEVWLSNAAIDALLDALGIDVGSGQRPDVRPSGELCGLVDPLFGPVLSLLTESPHHPTVVRSVALAPLLTEAASDFVQRAGLACVDTARVADIAERVGSALDRLPALAELRLPLNITNGGFVDSSTASCRVARSQTFRFLPRRRLQSPKR